MSETQVSKSNALLTFLGSLGGILIFVLIIWVAYLPNRPEPVNAQVGAERKAKADEARAAGISKLTGTELIDAGADKVRIPIEEAIQLVVDNFESLGVAPEPKAPSPAMVEAIDTARLGNKTSAGVAVVDEPIEEDGGEVENVGVDLGAVEPAAEGAVDAVE
jgi:hypothetical protein